MLENASNGRLEFAVQAHTLVGLQCTITQQAAHTFAVQAHTFLICLPMCLFVYHFSSYTHGTDSIVLNMPCNLLRHDEK